MTTYLVILAILVIEHGSLIYASSRPAAHELRIVGVFSLVMIFFFSPVLVDLGGGMITNVGAFWYTAVVIAQCITIERFGLFEARRMVMLAYLCLSFLCAMAACVSFLPAAYGEGALALSLRPIAVHAVDIWAGMVGSLMLGQVTLLYSYLWLRGRYGGLAAMLLASWACYFVAVPTFFGLMHFTHPDLFSLHVLAVGVLVKCELSVVFAPLFVVCARLKVEPPMTDELTAAIHKLRWH